MGSKPIRLGYTIRRYRVRIDWRRVRTEASIHILAALGFAGLVYLVFLSQISMP